jgi:hypothetical protein
MIRKPISLTEELDWQIHRTAVSEHKSEAEVIREKLCAGFAARKTARTGGDALLQLAAMAVKSNDPYLSRNIDKYLYEKP